MMKRMKQTLFAGGSAAIFMAMIALVAAPTPASAVNNELVDECTFCAAVRQTCDVGHRLGTQTCFVRMSGPGTCPPCSPCQTVEINPFR